MSYDDFESAYEETSEQRQRRLDEGRYNDFYEYAEDIDRRYRRKRYRNTSGVEEKRKKRFINSNWDDRHPIIKALYCLNYFL